MKAFRTISALVLAFLVLVSSTSLVVGMHSCGGEVQDIAFFSKAEGCKKEQKFPPCHRHATVPCCEDETVINEGGDLKGSAADIQILPFAPVHVQQALVLISEIIPSMPDVRTKYYHYDPLLRSCDLTVAHQAFLI